jgi:hypothetical protein
MHNAHTRYLIFFLFICFSAFSIIGLATNGSFNLFSPAFLWKAYNYYFLGMLDGRLDVPVESIGREGGYFNNKAYMYYGMLSVLPRAFLYPFVDLTQTSASYFSIIFFTLIGHITLQISLISAFLERSRADGSLLKYGMLLGVSCLLWFGSGSFMISQSATIYHEPYAAALCLVNIYLAFLVKDGFFMDEKRSINLIPYALLAGLCIHARMPTALTLYLVTGILILLQSYRIKRSMGQRLNSLTVVLQSLRSFWPAISILAFWGVSILLLNYAKYGNALAFMGGNYGYFFLEGYTERRCNLVPTSDFSSFFRIVANAYIYLTGDEQGHWSLSWHLATGFGRKELPLVPLGILWFLPIACFVFVVFTLLRGIKQTQNKVLLIALLAFSVGAIFQLKYPTITHRYTAELWVPLFVCVLFMWFKLISHLPAKHAISRWGKVIYFALGLILFSSITYQIHLALTSNYYLNDGPVEKHTNYHYSAEDNAFLSSLTTEKIKMLKQKYQIDKNKQCAKLAERSGVSDLLKSKKLLTK